MCNIKMMLMCLAKLEKMKLT